MRNANLVVVVSLAITVSVSPAQSIEWWSGDWEGALQEAAARNVPIFVAWIMDDEEANDRIVAGLYKDESFIKATARAVCVLACPGTHSPKEQRVRGKLTKVCSKFGSVPCVRHKKMEMEIRGLFWPTGKVATPTHVVVLPDEDETKFRSMHDVVGSGTYVKAIADAQRKLGGRGLSGMEHRRARDLMAQGKESLAWSDLLQVMACLEELEPLVKGTPLGKTAASIREAVNAQGAELRQKAEEAAAAGRWIDAMRMLRDGGKVFKGTATARGLMKLESRLGRSREGREAVRILKAEARALPLFNKAVGYEKDRDYVKAVNMYYRVLSTAPEAPLGTKARARIDEFKADPAVNALVGRIVASRDANLEFKAARKLMRSGDEAGGRAMLQGILEKWPGTASAKKARQLLEKQD